MTATPNFATDAAVGAVDPAAPMASMGPFVLNLCSSTTPMALAQTDLAELKRFTFFVSRRFEEGRERFRLHMGYFATLAEAEEWLNVVREIYPGAWAGEAPGKKLRERAAAAQAAQAQHAAGPQPSVSPPRPPPVAVAPPPAPAAPEPEIPPGMSPLDAALSLRVPVLKAAPPAPVRPAAKAPPAPLAAPAPAARKPAAAAPVAAAPAAPAAPPRKPAPPVAPKIAAPAAAKPAASIAKSPVAVPAAAKPAAPAISARPPAAVAAPAAKPQGAAAPARSEPVAKAEALTLDDKPRGVFGDSNVREVLKALGDASATGETRLMRAPLPPAPLKEAAPATPPKNPLSDTQVLKLLETRRPEGTEATGADPAHGAIPLLKPDDTGTREALKEAVTQDAPVLFAVQLQWSVQPVELDKVPPLAIFSAYTLYTVEGSRDSRKWFGLRLGFFSDAISAKQVAHYVRSEFASVAVVPVSAQEKARATDQDKQAATLNAPIAAPEQRVDEFKLIDDDTAQTEVAKLRAGQAAAPVPAATPKPVTDGKGRPLPGRPIPKVAVGRAVTQPAAAPPPPVAPAAAAAARGRGRTPGRVGAGEKRGAQSLEETLEILGAGQLSIDNGSGETLNESGVRHLRVEVQKNSPFSKLLERLSERMKKP